MALRPKKHLLDNKYLLYLLLSPLHRQKLLEMTRGSTVPRVLKTDITELAIPLPPLETQKKISGVLADIDDKIYLNQQINQTLEQMAQAIFKSWFVDFEPVKAKMAAKKKGRDPQRAAMCAISGKTEAQLDKLPKAQQKQLAATAALFPDAMEESKLGMIPVGWEESNVGSLLELSVGGDWGKDVPDDKHTEQARIIRGTDIPTLRAGHDSGVPVRFVDIKKLNSRKLCVGDIVIEVSGGSKKQPTGRSIHITESILRRLDSIAEPASFCRLFRPKDKHIGLILGQHLQYIYGQGKTWLYQNQSTGISNFQTKVFLKEEVLALPQREIAECFYRDVQPMIDKVFSNENLQLAQMRDTLLPKLLSGELEVSHV